MLLGTSDDDGTESAGLSCVWHTMHHVTTLLYRHLMSLLTLRLIPPCVSG